MSTQSDFDRTAYDEVKLSPIPLRPKLWYTVDTPLNRAT